MKMKTTIKILFGNKHHIGLIAGLVLFSFLLIIPTPAGMTVAGQRAAAVSVLMICWWLTEALPLSATAMAPLVFYPILGIMDSTSVALPYANHNIFLFLGGFCIAISMQKWNLHRRIALQIIKVIGNRPRRLVLGFMIATAFLSMWISNTATTMMMLPIGLALITHFCGEKSGQTKRTNFGTALMLGIAYSASIGGIGTLIGTPPNLVLAGQITLLFPDIPELGFFQWMQVGIPLVVIFLPTVWCYLTFYAFPPENNISSKTIDIIEQEIALLGPLNRGEKYTLAVFVTTCFAWLFRKNIAVGSLVIPGWTSLFGLEPFVSDATIAIAAALLLFVIPINLKKKEFVLDWPSAVKLPWGILLLFGGGFAMAKGFMDTGLSDWVGQHMMCIAVLPLVCMIALTCLFMTFLTETTSNTAATTMLLPILATLSGMLDIHPFALIFPATLSASCAFMFPIATPPNAIIFGSGQISVPIMARTGLILNFFGVILITALMYILAVPAFDIVLTKAPDWALQ